MIYKSSQGEVIFNEIYDKMLTELCLDFEDRHVATRFGETHVIVTGPADAPPIFMLHGGNTVNAETLAWYVPLATHYRIYAPDLIGHPGKSAQTKLSIKDFSYGQWAADVVHALEIGPVPFLGTSYGGSVLLQTAVVAPELITKAILVASGSIASASKLSMLRQLLWPLLIYKIFGSRHRLASFLKKLMDTVSESNLDVMAMVFKHLKMNDLLPELSDDSLRCLTAPTLVFSGENDIFFPAQKVAPRAQAMLPNLVGLEVLEKACHYPTPVQLDFINGRIHTFLAAK